MTEPTNQPAAELLPCPFCGEPAEERLTDGPTRGFIGCFSCMIGTPFNVPYGEREREAWNTRAQPLCPLHKALQGKLEVIIGHNCVACSLNERAAMLDMLAPFAPADGSEDSLQVLQSVIEYTRHQPAAVPLSVRVLIALDEDARVRECIVLTDRKQADELYHRLREIWGGANVAMASRAIDALPLNLHEKIAEVTEIVQ